MSNFIEINANPHTYVDPFPGKSGDEEVFVECGRCWGRGHMSEYANTFGGVCFECNGAKGHTSTIRKERTRESGRISRLNKTHKEWAAKAARHNENMAKAEEQYPELAAWGELMDTDNFLSDLWSKAFDYDLSEKQIAAAAKTVQRKQQWKMDKAAADAAKKPAPEGKVVVAGEVKSVKYQESDFGYGNSGQWKMLVAAEGDFTVWATIPEKLFAQLQAEVADDVNVGMDEFKGRKVEFTATLERSRNDETHAFGKRPSKVKLLAK